MKSLLGRYGLKGLVYKAAERRSSPVLAYSKLWQKFLPTTEELERQRKERLSYEPLISIVVPAFETPGQYLRELLDSVRAQTYANWELCLADGSRTDETERLAREYASRDKRIFVRRLKENGGISENTNAGFSMARGEYVALMDHDDLLAPNALYEMARCLNASFSKEERAAALIYSDEDKVSGDGSVYSRPHFKPDFNLEFLRRNNYFCHFLVVSSALLKKAGGLKKEYDGAQDYDFVLRCVDAGAVVRHVPKILYHWRIHEGSTAGNGADKAYAFDNGCRAIEAHLFRCGEPGTARVTANLGAYRVSYRLRGEYRVTVAAGSEGQLLALMEHYGKEGRDFGEYSLNVQYLQISKPDCGIEKTRTGDYILYIRKDVAAEPEGLIEGLLGFCQHERTGAAGARILSPKGRVASCGLVYGPSGRLAGACRGLPAAYKGYFLHGVIPKNVSALSFDCVMFRTDALARTGGPDQSMKGVFQDADLCFRLAEEGYSVAVVPEVTARRMKEPDDAGEDGEARERFFLRWKNKLAQPDPCYNCNLSLKEDKTYALRAQEDENEG